MGPIQIRQIWGIAICIWVAFIPLVCTGQLTPQLPPTSGTTNPWMGYPPQYGTFPQTGYPTTPAGVYDPNALGFRPSTAPVYGQPNPYAPVSSPSWNLGNLFGYYQPTPTVYGANPYAANPYGTSSFTTPAYPQTTYPPGVYPNATPNVLYPGTGGSQPLNSTWNLTGQPYPPNPYGGNPYTYSWNNWWNSAGTNVNYGTTQVIRLFQGPRFRHTWLSGSDGFDSKQPNSLESNDSDVSLVFAIPNFLNSTRPLYIIPSYSQHVWEGPTAPGTDIPGNAFSGFLDIGWETNPQQTLGLEFGVRVGVFSAFDAVNSESVRVPTKALARLRLTPTSTLRAGVFYLDRNKIKLLPAVGLLWMPNQDTRFDLFFPEPKLAHYVATLGNTDVWWYLSGYYGGGAWTIKQTDESNDEIDINDIRLLLGLEFGKSDQIRQGFRLGFIEAGYAFNRELIYRVRSTSNLDLENSFVIRAGFAY